MNIIKHSCVFELWSRTYRIGRKNVFFVALLVEIVAGFLMAVVPYWAAYGIARVAVGFAHPGIFVIAVVIGLFVF